MEEPTLELELATKETAQLNLFDVPEAWEDEWQDMPEFRQADAMPHRTVYVHFATDEDVQEFCELLKQKITRNTKFIWYPEQRPQVRLGWAYKADEP